MIYLVTLYVGNAWKLGRKYEECSEIRNEIREDGFRVSDLKTDSRTRAFVIWSVKLMLDSERMSGFNVPLDT